MCSCTHTHTYIHTYTHNHANIHTYIHTFIHTYIHTYTHTYSVAIFLKVPSGLFPRKARARTCEWSKWTLFGNKIAVKTAAKQKNMMQSQALKRVRLSEAVTTSAASSSVEIMHDKDYVPCGQSSPPSSSVGGAKASQTSDACIPLVPKSWCGDEVYGEKPLEAMVPKSSSGVETKDNEIEEIFNDLLGQYTAKMANQHMCENGVVGEKDAYEQALENIQELGDLDIRGPVGQRFQRAHKTGTAAHKEYNADRSFAAKQAFRVAWAKSQLTQIRESRKHVRSWEKVSRECGEFVCFAKLVENQGWHCDPKGAVKRGTNYAQACIKMSGDWISYNKMSKNLEFFEVKRQFLTVFTEKWELCSEHYDVGDLEQAKAVAEAEPEGALTPTTTAAARKGGVPRGAGGGSGGKPVIKTGSQAGGKLGGTDDGKGDSLAKLILSANKTKKEFHAVSSSTSSLIAEIQDVNNKAWQWANHDNVLADIKAATKKLDESLCPFDRMFLIKDSGKLKKELGKEHLTVQLQAFVKLNEFIAKLRDEQQNIVAMHQARKR